MLLLEGQWTLLEEEWILLVEILEALNLLGPQVSPGIGVDNSVIPVYSFQPHSVIVVF